MFKRSFSSSAKILRAAVGNFGRRSLSTQGANRALLCCRSGTAATAPVRLYSQAMGQQNSMAGYLAEEIAQEKRSLQSLPKFEGYDVKTTGASVVLKKSTGDEKITIRFNTNHSIFSGDESMDTPDDQAVEQQPPTSPEGAFSEEIQAKPPFTVEISAPGAPVFSVHCVVHGKEPYDIAAQGPDEPKGEQPGDNFGIEEAAFLDADGNWGEDTYTLSSDVLDNNMYDLLVAILDQRGINDEFVERLTAFATAYENQSYVSFLEQLKTFVK